MEGGSSFPKKATGGYLGLEKRDNGAIQAVLMSTAIACYRVPTEVNVVYSSRGLWTILLVAWFGQRLCLAEGKLGKWVKIRRLTGSVLLGICILLIA